MAGRFSVDGVFKAVDRFTGPVRRMQNSMRRFTRSTEGSMRALNRHAGSVISGFQRVGVAAAAAGVAVGLVGADVVQTGAEFEQALTNAAAKFPGAIRRGTAEFAALEAAASNVGATTEFTASQAAGALDFLAMAGFNATQAVAALPGVVDLATASGMDLARATDIASDSLGAFNLMSSDAETLGRNLASVNDLIARTTTTANTNVEDMFEAIRTGGPTATAAGQSMQTFAAMVGTMANAGIKGSEAGTALRNMMLRLQAPAAGGAAQLRRLHISVADGQGNMRDMVDIMRDLQNGMEGMGTVARAEIMNDIFGQRAIGPATVLLQSGADALEEYRGRLLAADGAAATMAATMRDTTHGDIEGMKSALESVKLAIFAVAGPAVREMIQSITEWTRANREVIASGIQDFITLFADNIETITARAEGIAFVAAGFLAVATAIKAASAAQALFNIIATANPYVLVIMAIIAAIGLLIAYWPEISAFFSELWQMAEVIAGDIGAWFSETWDSIVDGVMTAVDWVTDAFNGWLDFMIGIHTAIAEVFVGLAMVILEPFLPGLRLVRDAFMAAVDFLGGLFAFLWDDIKARATAVGDWIASVWNRIVAFAQPAVEMIKGYFAFMWDDITTRAQAVYDTFVSIWGSITGFFSGLWEGVVAGFNEHIAPLIEMAGGFIRTLRGIGAETLGTDGGGTGDGTAPQVVSPQERTGASVSETRTTTTSSATVTIRDQTGRARMTGGGPGITFQPSGAPG